MAKRTTFTADEVRALLTELGSRLDAKGVRGTLYIVGGAAIALEFDSRRITADIDAIFDPATTIRAEAEAMAAEKGLPRAWLNSNAAPFIPGSDDDAVTFDEPGLAISLASPRHLLAMKMARGTDLDDLRTLFEVLDITRPEQAADIALEVYGPDTLVLTERADLILLADDVLRSMTSGR